MAEGGWAGVGRAGCEGFSAGFSAGLSAGFSVFFAGSAGLAEGDSGGVGRAGCVGFSAGLSAGFSVFFAGSAGLAEGGSGGVGRAGCVGFFGLAPSAPVCPLAAVVPLFDTAAEPWPDVATRFFPRFALAGTSTGGSYGWGRRTTGSSP